MAANPGQEQDLTVHGPRTQWRGVKATETEYRPWIASFPICPVLDSHQIAHVGLMKAIAPYEILRTDQTSSYFLACSRGEGRVLIDGSWRRCGAGTACLHPAHIRNAFHAVPGVKWEFGWVCHIHTRGDNSLFESSSPVLARYDPAPLCSAIDGLIHECAGAAAPRAVQHWAELVQEYVLRFVKPAGQDQALIELWQRVAAELEADWTLARLARESGYSKEHLRRLCHSELGRSPMHQVIHLRLRRAAELLATTRQKVEMVAETVGYHSPFVFSKAFRKWVGWQPTEYRRRMQRLGSAAIQSGAVRFEFRLPQFAPADFAPGRNGRTHAPAPD